MSNVSYTYSKATNFTSATIVVLSDVQNAVLTSSIASATIQYITQTGDVIIMTFNNALSTGDQSSLVTLMAAYTDLPIPQIVTDITVSTLKNKSLQTNTNYFVDSTDGTKEIGFSSSSNATATILTLASQTTANRTILFPDITDTVTTLTATQTLTNKTITNAIITGTGSSTATSSTFSVNPSSTVASGALNYYFNNFTAPVLTGSTTGSAYTTYIAGAPTGTITTPYSLYVASGKTYLGGALQIPTGAAAGYILSSDSTGNTTWVSPTTTTFGDGTVSLPGISFAAQPGTGFYRPASGQIGVELAGVGYVLFSTTATTLANGQTLNVGSGGTSSPANIFGLITGSNGLTISSGTSALQAVTAAGLVTANLGLTVTTGQTVNIGTSGTTSPLNVRGLITGLNGLTISVGTTNVQTFNAAGLLTANLGLTVLTGQTANIGTTGTTSPLNVYGLITGTNGLTISAGTSALQAITAAGLVTANLGINVTNGQIVNIGTSGTTSSLNVFGLVTGNNGLTISAGTSALQAITAAGLVAANLGLTVLTGQTANVGTTGTTSPLNVYGLITGTNGLTISSGTSALQATTAAGLITANLGITVTNGQTANIGTSGLTSILNIFGTTNHSGTSTFTGVGNSTAASTGVYIAPGSTTVSGSSNYYFTNLIAPTTTGTTTGSAYTLYIAGAPSGTITTPYAAYIAAGKTYIGGALQIATGAAAGYILSSDASGNTTWISPTTTTFGDGTASLPGIAFAAQPGTGFYRPASGQIGVELAGIGYVLFTTTSTTLVNGQTLNVGTTGTTSPLNVFGLITGTNGLTISSGTSALQAVTAAGLVTANLGLTVLTGQTANIGTTGTTSPLNVFGLITGTNGITISSGTSVLQAVTAAGLVTANLGLTVLTGQTTNIGTTGTTSPLNVYGLITGTNGLTISSGTSALQAVTTAGLMTANLGITVTNGQTANIGTSGLTSTLNIFGTTNHSGITAFTGVGNSTAASASVYIAPVSTVTAGSANYYYTYLAVPATTGTTTGSAYTFYIAGAPSGTITTPYAAYIATGKTYIGGALQIATGASAGYILSSDASGNTTWVSPTTTTFGDGTASLPGIAFAAQPGTGFYRPASGQIGVELAGVGYVLFTTTSTTLVNGQTLAVGTTGTTSQLNVFGLITGNNGLTISAGTSALQAVTTAGLVTANLGITVATGQTLSVGTTGTTSPLNVYGLITGTNGLTISSGTSALQAVTTAGLMTANLGITVANGQTANIGTSGLTSIINVFGVLNQSGIATFTGVGNSTAASTGVYIAPSSTAASAANNYYFTNLTAPAMTGTTTGSAYTFYIAGAPSGTITTPYAAYIATGKTYIGGALQFTTGASAGYVLSSDASGNASWINPSTEFGDGTSALPGMAFGSQPGTGFYKPASGQIGVELAGNNYVLFTTTSTTLVNGQTLAVGTTGTTSPLNVFGLITGTNGLTISAGNSALQTITAAGLVTANLGITVATGQTLSVGTTGTTSPLNVFGLITGTNGLTISSGTSALQTITAAGLVTANLGITVTNGQTANIGTSGLTSTLNVFGTTNNSGTSTFTGIGNSTAASASVYIAPASTAASSTNNYYFTNLTSPVMTGTTTGSAYTFYIAGAPSGTITTPYAAYIATGKTYIGGALQIATGAAAGYLLSSDASGNTTWISPTTTTFGDGTSSLPGIAFASETGTGFYRPASGQIGVELAGNNYVLFSTTATTLVNGQVLNVGTTGTTSPLNVFGLITGTNGLTISSGTSALQAVTAAGLITANLGLTVLTGKTTNIGTTGTTSPLNVFGLITGTNGLTISAGISALQAITAAGLVTANLGLTVLTGQTANIGTTGTTSPLNVFGLITGTNGLTISSGTSALQAITAAGLVTANLGLTVLTGQTLNVGTTGTTSAANIFGLITGSNGLTISSGTSALQAITAAGIITANLGLNITNGQTLNVGTSGLTSTLNVFGVTNHSSTVSFNAIGNSTAINSNVYIAPGSTAVTGTSNYYYTYLATPATTGTTTGSAYTFYIANAPSGTITTPYAAYIAAGKTYIGGALQIPTNASNGYLLASDANGNAGWILPAFADGTSSLPGITFTAETGTGFYRPASGQIGLELAGNNYATFTTTSTTFVNGQTFNIGTTGTTSPLNVRGLITGSNGLTISSGTSALQAITAAGSITANAGMNITSGQILNVGTSGTGSVLNVFGIIQGFNGITVTAGTSALQAITAAGLVTANLGLTVASGQTANIGTAGTTSPLNVFGLITGSNGLSLVGSAVVQGIACTSIASGGVCLLTGAGNTVASGANLYAGPQSTPISGANNYYFSYFDVPTTTGTTTGSAYTSYIAGAPTGTITNPYALYVATGKTYVGGALQIPTAPITGGSLISDATGNASWGYPNLLNLIATSQTSVAGTSATFAIITGMTVTVAVAGTYKFEFSGIVEVSATRIAQIRLTQNGTANAASAVSLTMVANNMQMISTFAIIVCAAGDIITTQFAISGGGGTITFPTFKTLFGLNLS
jgi:hypothetical protein